MKWTLLALFAIGCGGAPKAGPSNQGGAPSGDPYAVAFVVQGWELWIGNDDMVGADDPSMYRGALKPLAAAFVGSDFAKVAPPGSQAALVTFADKVDVRVPLGPIAKVDAAALGSQKDYFGKIGTELVLGITAAASELGKTNVPRKYLIVIGDGNDTNNEAARDQLAKLKAELAAKHITVLSFVYKTALSADGAVVSALAADTVTLQNADAVTAHVKAALDGLANRGH